MQETNEPRTGNDRDSWRDLRVALATVASFQTSIRHADAKTATVATLELGGMAMAASEVSVFSDLVRGRPAIGVAAGAAAAALLIGVLASMWMLAGALRPRIDGPRGPNRFAFPNLVADDAAIAAVDLESQRVEAWQLATRLASIAMAKHARVRGALPWVGVTLAATAAWFVIMEIASATG